MLREEVNKMEKQLKDDKYDLSYAIESKSHFKNDGKE